LKASLIEHKDSAPIKKKTIDSNTLNPAQCECKEQYVQTADSTTVHTVHSEDSTSIILSLESPSDIKEILKQIIQDENAGVFKLLLESQLQNSRKSP
jgi:AAA15 family ATPase/GTPase